MTLPAAVSASRNELRTVAPKRIELTTRVVKQVFEEKKV